MTPARTETVLTRWSSRRHPWAGPDPTGRARALADAPAVERGEAVTHLEPHQPTPSALVLRIQRAVSVPGPAVGGAAR